ncbi:Uncharacterized protein HZ326_2425 [Fusarium oxysporum f. sp. albedinis]|nr:Uncharacterized protein HZ326_2425 [Fusarium oxysporum f. sp. albedinis]
MIVPSTPLSRLLDSQLSNTKRLELRYCQGSHNIRVLQIQTVMSFFFSSYSFIKLFSSMSQLRRAGLLECPMAKDSNQSHL